MQRQRNAGNTADKVIHSWIPLSLHPGYTLGLSRNRRLSKCHSAPSPFFLKALRSQKTLSALTCATAEPFLYRSHGTQGWRMEQLIERKYWRVTGKGDGIHWEDLDEDISVENLLLGQPWGESQSSFQKWLSSRTWVTPCDALAR